MCDLLWSDPEATIKRFNISPRGSGIMMNRDNKNEDENKKEGALSPVQSDDEDDKEYKTCLLNYLH